MIRESLHRVIKERPPSPSCLQAYDLACRFYILKCLIFRSTTRTSRFKIKLKNRAHVYVLHSSLVLLFCSTLFQVTIWYVDLVSLLDETLTRNLTSSQSFVKVLNLPWPWALNATEPEVPPAIDDWSASWEGHWKYQNSTARFRPALTESSWGWVHLIKTGLALPSQ